MDRPIRLPIGLLVDFEEIGAGDRAVVVRSLQQSALFREYQQAFEATTGLPLVSREAGSFRLPLHGSKRVNRFCALMTRTSPTCAACLQLQQRVEQAATRESRTLQCYAGLSESAVPVLTGGHVLGYLQTGQVFLRRPSRRRFQALARTLPGGEAGVGSRERESAYFQTRVVPARQYQMTIRLLAVFAAHLGTVSNQLLIGRALSDTPLLRKLRDFVAAHHCEPIGTRDAARAANISRFHFCKVFKGATGLTFTGYLSRVRIEAVKGMLLDPGLRVSEAAYAAGFQSLSQFNRVFRRVTGEAPSRYRGRLPGFNGKPVLPAALARAV